MTDAQLELMEKLGAVSATYALKHPVTAVKKWVTGGKRLLRAEGKFYQSAEKAREKLKNYKLPKNPRPEDLDRYSKASWKPTRREVVGGSMSLSMPHQAVGRGESLTEKVKRISRAAVGIKPKAPTRAVIRRATA